MTPEAMPHGTEEHPEVTELSDLTEGILPVSRGREVRAHLDQCPLCADVHASLLEIRGALGSLPGPPRMPDDVADRIDAALAAEALLDAERHTAESAPVSRETGAEEPAPVSRETAAAASLRKGRSGPSRPAGHAPGGTGPGRSRRLARHRGALLTTAGVVGALVLGGALLQGLALDSTDDAGSTAAGEALLKEERGGVSAAKLEDQVRELLSQAPTAEDGQPDLTVKESPGDGAPLAGGATVVPSCVRAGIDRPESPLAAEPGRSYQGRPSYLVVLPHPGDRERVDAYVVDSSCTTDPGSAPGEVLLKRTFPRD